ncbi:MAG: HNH endonuclease [Chloroflexi bacterium]|nr:HNH endonuclease [Chloroflexota bacterium]
MNTPYSVDDYKKAFQAILSKMTEQDREMLRIQYTAPERTISPQQLAVAINYNNYPIINRMYGHLGRLLSDYLGTPPDTYDDGNPVWFTCLSDYKRTDYGIVWTMWPAVASALEELNIVKKTEEALPEEVYPGFQYVEGAVRQITVNAYERDPKARRDCIKYYGTRCQVCDIDLGEKYGEVGERYIHVHHVRPLAEIGVTYTIDPETDLVPVCPNCHSIMHRRTPPFSVEEVRKMIRKAQETLKKEL